MVPLQLNPVSRSSGAEVKRLFDQYKYKDYQLKKLSISKSTMVDWLVNNLQQKHLQTFYLKNSGRVSGLLSARHQPWISKMLNLRSMCLVHFLASGQDPLLLKQLLEKFFSETQGFDFLSCRLPSGDVNAVNVLEDYGFHFVGNEVFMALDMKNYQEYENEDLHGFQRCPAHLWPQVIELIEKVHIHNRYMNDGRISNNKVRQIYKSYIDEFGAKRPYRQIIYKEDDHVLGFIVYKFNRDLSRFVGRNYASLDFIGVDTEVRSKGIGYLLNMAALRDLAAEGADHVVVRTLGSNLPALRILSKAGFEVSSTDCQFHYWSPAQIGTENFYREKVLPKA